MFPLFLHLLVQKSSLTIYRNWGIFVEQTPWDMGKQVKKHSRIFLFSPKGLFNQ